MLAILRTRGLAGLGVCTGWGTRRAELIATMDHTDIRGLVTALHRSVAGLPRSSIGDHRGGCPHRPFEGSPHRVRASRRRSGVSTVMSWRGPPASRVSRSGARSDVPADIPDESGEFAGERDADLVVLQPAGPEPAVAVVQAQLRAPGDRADLGRLSFLTHLQGGADAGWVAVVPGRLDEDAANVTVACLGDRTEPALGAGSVFGGDQSQVSHQLARMGEAPQITELGDDGGGRDQIEPPQRHHGADEGVPAPVLDLLRQGLAQALHASLTFTDRLAVLGEGNVLGGVSEGDRGEVAFVGCRPGGLAAVAAAVTQHQRLKLLARLVPRPHRIHSCPAQVPDRLVALIRDRDRYELACAGQACEVQCIAPVSLDPLPRAARDLRGRHHLTTVAKIDQFARQCVTARTRLVHHVQAVRFPQLAQRLRQLRIGSNTESLAAPVRTRPDPRRTPRTSCAVPAACPAPSSAPQSSGPPYPRTVVLYGRLLTTRSRWTARVHPVRQ